MTVVPGTVFQAKDEADDNEGRLVVGSPSGDQRKRRAGKDRHAIAR